MICSKWLCITPRQFRELGSVENNINDDKIVLKTDQNKITINNNAPFVSPIAFTHNGVKENRLHEKYAHTIITRVSIFFFFKLKTGRYFYDFRLRLLRLVRLRAIGASIQLYYIILSSMSFPVLITAAPPVEKISNNSRHYSLYYDIVDKMVFLSVQMKTQKYNNIFFNNRKKWLV